MSRREKGSVRARHDSPGCKIPKTSLAILIGSSCVGGVGCCARFKDVDWLVCDGLVGDST